MKEKLFDSRYGGRVRYFLCPEDDFILNSLQKLNCDQYLYRLLKAEGYERVIFFEDFAHTGNVYAYDKFSHLSFMYPNKFLNVDLKNRDEINKIYEGIEDQLRVQKEGPNLGRNKRKTLDKKTSVMSIENFGKRSITTSISNAAAINEYFENNIQPVLCSNDIKTAVVIEMRLFESVLQHVRYDDNGRQRSGFPRDTAATIAANLRIWEKNDRERRNILIFVARGKSDFEKVFTEPSLSSLHSSSLDFLNSRSRTEAWIRYLKENGSFVEIDDMGSDEIANLLFRKKLKLEGNNSNTLDNIPFGKINTLALLIKEHLLQQRKIFKTIPYMGQMSIKDLNAYLDDEKFIAELENKCKRLTNSKSENINKLSSLSLERAYGIVDNIEESLDAIMSDFNKLQGEEIQITKAQALDIIEYFEILKRELDEKEQKGIIVTEDDLPYYNMLFFGAPGTGKTTIAKLIGRLMKAKGILPTGKVHIVQASELGSSVVHGVQEKLFSEAEKANGGVLFIDELQALDASYQGDGNLAEDFMRGIVSIINKYRDSMCVILCGYEDDVLQIVKFDDGAERRFKKIKLESYGIDTLMGILRNLLKKDNKTLDVDAEEKVRKIILADKAILGKSFGNAGYIKDTLIPPIKTAYYKRKGTDNVYTLEDVKLAFNNSDKRSILEEQTDTLDSIISEFDRLEGKEIQNAKDTVLRSINYFTGMKLELEEKEKQGKKVKDDDYPYYNMLFFGAPGTGKTTIANLVGRLMYAKGILPTSKVHLIQATDLGSGTVHGVQKSLAKEAEIAVGGVLLIDELQALKAAYQGGNLAEDFMRGIVATINKYRSNLSVILCGYEDELLQIIKYDKGASRRFPCKIKLDSYSVETLMMILHKILVEDGKKLDDGVEEIIKNKIQKDIVKQGKSFGNVGYLKDEIIGPIKAAYFERGEYDSTYNMKDIRVAFPEYTYEVNSNKATNFERMYISKNDFKKLEIPKEFEDYNADVITETERRELIKPSILFVSTDKGTGTAFLISPEGYAITCNHVVAGASEISARLRIPGRQGGSDSTHKCKVINADVDVDMALIKLEGNNFPYLAIAAPEDKIQDGETFTLSGYPLGMNEDVTSYTGSIANGSGMTDSNGNKYLYIEGEAKKGNSGSPLVSTKDGKVIGVLFGSDVDEHDEMNKMRPIKYFWDKFLK